MPTVRTNVLHIELSQIYANMLIPGISDNFLNEGFPVRGVDAADFTSSEFEGSAYYASGIASGSKIKIELNSPLSESTNWKASLPITVTYI